MDQESAINVYTYIMLIMLVIDIRVCPGDLISAL